MESQEGTFILTPILRGGPLVVLTAAIMFLATFVLFVCAVRRMIWSVPRAPLQCDLALLSVSPALVLFMTVISISSGFMIAYGNVVPTAPQWGPLVSMLTSTAALSAIGLFCFLVCVACLCISPKESATGTPR